MPKKKGQEEGKRLVTNTAYDLHVADGQLKGAAQLQFYYHPSHPPELENTAGWGCTHVMATMQRRAFLMQGAEFDS